MLIEHIGEDYYHVSLVDLVHHYDGGAERSFATCEQLIEWVKDHPSLVVKAVRRGEVGQKLAQPKPPPGYPPNPGAIYQHLENGDIICGELIVYDTYGLRKPGLGTGGG